MNAVTLAPFDESVPASNMWLDEIRERLGWQDRCRAFCALKHVLHSVRDQLTVEQVAALGAHLPALLRGFFYEGWHPHGEPVKECTREAFLERVATELGNDPCVNAEDVVRAVLSVVRDNIGGGENEHWKRVVPAYLCRLWP